MKIPGDLRRTITDVTEKVKEKGQQLGKEAQLQLQLKQAQVEHAKKIHQLGKRTYEWYRSGTMIVSGPVPPEVAGLCTELDAVQSRVQSLHKEIDETRQQSSSTDAAATTPALHPPAASTQAESAPSARQPLNDNSPDTSTNTSS